MTNESTEGSKEQPESKAATNDENDTAANVSHESGGVDSNATNHIKNIESNDQNDSNGVSKSMASKLTPSNLQDRIKNFLRTEIKQPSDKNVETDAASKINSEYYLDDEYTEHYLPQQVDTTDVAGEMVQVFRLRCCCWAGNLRNSLFFHRFQVDYIITYCWLTHHKCTRGEGTWRSSLEEKIQDVT